MHINTLGKLTLFTFISLLLTLPAFAAGKSKMVYMQETATGKQIVLADSDGKNAKTLTSGEEWHLYPELDAKGRLVVMVQGSSETDQNIFAYSLQTGEVTQWTDDVPGLHLHPDFSGDGQFLAFSGPYGENAKNQIAIWAIDEDVTGKIRPGKRSVITSEFPSYFPALDSTGKILYYQRSKSSTNRDIVRYTIAEDKTEVLTDPAGNSMAPSVSFDDRYLAYTSLVNGNWDIYRMDLQTKAVKRITSAKSKDYAPTFRPDGTIAFASDRTGRFQLYSVDPNCVKDENGGGECEQVLATGEGDLYAPSVSGDASYTQHKKPEISGEPRSSFGAAALGDKVFVVGGHMGLEHTYPPESFSDAMTIYSQSENTWADMTPRPNPAHGFGIVAYGNYVYAFGGFAYDENNSPKWKSIAAIDRYDVTTDTWTTVAQLPRARSSNVVAQVGTKVYLLGGWDATPRFAGDLDGTFHKEIDVFDLATEKVTANVATLPNPLRRAFSGAVKGDEIYLAGGITQGGSHFDFVDNVTVFNTKTKTWREAAKMPFATFAPAVGILGNDLLLFGGMYKQGDSFDYVNHVYRLALTGKTWTHTGRYLSEPKGFSQAVNLDATKLGILGGHVYHDDSNSPVATFETLELN